MVAVHNIFLVAEDGKASWCARFKADQSVNIVCQFGKSFSKGLTSFWHLEMRTKQF